MPENFKFISRQLRNDLSSRGSHIYMEDKGIVEKRKTGNVDLKTKYYACTKEKVTIVFVGPGKASPTMISEEEYSGSRSLKKDAC